MKAMASKNVDEKLPIKKTAKAQKKNDKIRKPKTVKPSANSVKPKKNKEAKVAKKENLQNGASVMKSRLPKAYPFEMTVEVSNLPPNHKEVDIVEAFNKYGSITYVQKISKSKAVVAFLGEEEAKSAALKANRVARIGNQVLTVTMRSKKMKEVDESAERTIFVFRVDSAITEDDIRNHFEACGKILSIAARKRASEYYFVVEFADSAAGKAALNLHNSMLKDCLLSVRLKSKSYVPWYPSRTVVLWNKSNISKLEGSLVTSIFEKCGEIENCDIFFDRPRLAMITFKQEESAAEALKLNGKNLNGILIAAELYATELQREALPQKIDGHVERLDLARAKKRKVYIKKIPTDVSEEDLKNIFNRCGRVERVNIVPENGAIIEFSDSDGYCKAFTLHSYPLMGQNIYLVPYSELKIEKNTNKRQASNQKSNGQSKKIKKED